MVKFLLLFSLLGFSSANIEVHGFFSHSDKKFIYLQLDHENQIVLNKEFLTRSQMQKIFSSGDKELNIAVAPKAFVKKTKSQSKAVYAQKIRKT